ncbi:hypothetical protein SRABI27_02436 [Pedobacter sp. Bi27]|uniref:DUF4435 domain-containing protein n=1 Tax=unclassified Pedobacter TaxID=2628915 RepID=UPI001D55D1D4|nr:MULTISPECIES: DUF4435 domain-containing protein [unclassified Pedobacter]CAH0229449.1 hypothetical protein SRABI27_02436 [Pedobacter sp. Bi27]CAH0242626.1 hypothetical protein SRABI36_03008 [Pedobacter sp. Bi36]CAH0268484.1 hypothetical protein SRABI126_03408 [Pedobacter sp. Bi126]
MSIESQGIMPTRSLQAKSNFGILFDQFNDINFYVEDVDKEHFYFHLFKNLFNGIKINRIIGLNGKANVIKAAESIANSKKDVYIVDQDFDDFFRSKQQLPNLFYLRKYSIENYLINQEALFELVKEEKTTLKNADFEAIFQFDNFLAELDVLLLDLISCFPIVFLHELSCGYYSINIPRDLNIITKPYSLRGNYISDYIALVKSQYILKYPTGDFDNEFDICKDYFSSDSLRVNAPGKCLMNILKFRLTGKFGVLTNTDSDSFTYRVGKNSSIESLKHLKQEIDRFIN